MGKIDTEVQNISQEGAAFGYLVFAVFFYWKDWREGA